MAEIQRQPVNSSDIASIGYDEATETLEMILRGRPKISGFSGQIPLVQFEGTLKDPHYSVNADGLMKSVVGLLIDRGDTEGVPGLQMAPTGTNACLYTLEHPQKAPSLGVSRANPLGAASQQIEEIGKSLIGGLFSE